FQKEGKLVAVIVPNTNDPGSGEEAVRAAVEERSRELPSYQRLTDVVISRQPLPRTPLGKVQLHKLEELYEQAGQGEEGPAQQAGPLPVEEMSPEDRALLENPAARQVWDWLARRHPDRRLTPDTSPQLDLNVDSM